MDIVKFKFRLAAPAKPGPGPMGPTAYPAVPTNGVSDHDWKLDTELRLKKLLM